MRVVEAIQEQKVSYWDVGVGTYLEVEGKSGISLEACSLQKREEARSDGEVGDQPGIVRVERMLHYWEIGIEAAAAVQMAAAQIGEPVAFHR